MKYSGRTKRIAFALGILLLSAPGLRAQLADRHPLSLAEALAIAKKQNVEVMLARLQVLESRQATHIERSGLLPQANLPRP